MVVPSAFVEVKAEAAAGGAHSGEPGRLFCKGCQKPQL